jgi:signal transduction histidine kinase
VTQEQKGTSTRLMLVAGLVLVIASITILSLLVIQNRMRRQVLDDFSGDLAHSVETFQSFESQRLAALQRENALLADLPSLRALMTTNDERTIADSGLQFWKVGDNDLFALASTDGHVVAAFTRGAPADAELRSDLGDVITRTGKHYLLSGGRLFGYSVRPLYFGSEQTGTLLGYVISGYAIDTVFLQQVNRSSAAEIAFLAGDRVVASTLQSSFRQALESHPEQVGMGQAGTGGTPATISLGGERYLSVAHDLSNGASVPLRLVVMKSFEQAEKAQHEINRLLLLVGLFALLAGTGLMLAISSMVTRPLEHLAESVRAFGMGDSDSSLPQNGTREVRELSVAFAAMREEIQQTNHALLEAERLATIGRMASSVSHDLRHYLAAVYANAEFLASSRLSEDERAELFADIRMAVNGTTELIDSLLIFSRANGAAQRAPEAIAGLVERAIALVRAHPDAGRVLLQTVYDDPAATAAVVDSKQMERAIYNLLLNACQAARGSAGVPTVTAEITVTKSSIAVTITDDGPGVSAAIRDSLFEPFVSAGKQNGTGLGLTLAQCVAEEHGGSVQLVSSRPGETIFVLSVARGPLSAENSEGENPAEVQNETTGPRTSSDSRRVLQQTSYKSSS